MDEYGFPLIMGAFGILFIIWIFWKALSDNKRDEKYLTEVFQNYGVKADAEIVAFRNCINTDRTMPYKYEISVSFPYESPTLGNIMCLTTIKTGNEKCIKYKDEKSIPIVFIPKYADYLNSVINPNNLKKVDVRYYLLNRMILAVDDLSTYTKLNEL